MSIERNEYEKLKKQCILDNIPKKYLGHDSILPIFAKEYLEHLDQSLYITGGVATGKTVYAATLCKLLCDRDWKIMENILWFNYTSLLIRLKKEFNSSEGNPYELAENIARHKGVLVIDDIGTEKVTDFVKEITYFIINEREINEYQTIITSNLNLSAFDERVSSRIAGMCKILKFKGQDRRNKKEGR